MWDDPTQCMSPHLPVGTQLVWPGDRPPITARVLHIGWSASGGEGWLPDNEQQSRIMYGSNPAWEHVPRRPAWASRGGQAPHMQPCEATSAYIERLRVWVHQQVALAGVSSDMRHAVDALVITDAPAGLLCALESEDALARKGWRMVCSQTNLGTWLHECLAKSPAHASVQPSCAVLWRDATGSDSKWTAVSSFCVHLTDHADSRAVDGGGGDAGAGEQRILMSTSTRSMPVVLLAPATGAPPRRHLAVAALPPLLGHDAFAPAARATADAAKNALRQVGVPAPSDAMIGGHWGSALLRDAGREDTCAPVATTWVRDGMQAIRSRSVGWVCSTTGCIRLLYDQDPCSALLAARLAANERVRPPDARR